MLAALTGLGLSAAAGFNAYIPFLIVACVARFTTLVTLPSEFAWIESWWAIGGAAILLVSVELDEILGLSDRIAVMFDGRIMGERLPDRTTAGELGLLMAGVDPATHRADEGITPATAPAAAGEPLKVIS